MQIYVHADMLLKEEAQARVIAPDAKPDRDWRGDTLLVFLETL